MKRKNILIGILVLLLILSNVYFIFKSQEADYRIVVGRPETDAENNIEAIAYDPSITLDKDQVTTVFFSFLTAEPADNPEIANTAPNAVMMLFVPETNVVYRVKLWLTEDSVIYTIGDTEYRKINAAYAPELRSIIEAQLALNGPMYNGGKP